MRTFFCILALLVAGAVRAAAPSATVSWIAPTQNTDLTPITGPITYNLYEGPTTTITTAAAQTGITTVTLTTNIGAIDGTTACYAVTAVVGGVESAQSNAACKTFPAATPTAPSGLTVK
jgi:hypothetical protein